MAGYDALRDYLNERNSPEVRMSFGAVDELIAGGLPDLARTDPAWWTDRARVWTEAGYEVARVELDRRMVTFAAPSQPVADEPALPLGDDGLPADDELRRTWELAGIGPIEAHHVRRFVGGDAEQHLARLVRAGLLVHDGRTYRQSEPFG